MTGTRRFTIGLAVLVPALWAAAPALACLCSPPLPAPRDELLRSAAVFEGTILKVSEGNPYIKAKVKVGRRWKGPDVAEMELGTAAGGGSCGVTFAAGQSWLFYTRRDCSLHLASICTRTTNDANTIASDIAALGAPLAAGATVPDGGTDDGGMIPDGGVCKDGVSGCSAGGARRTQGPAPLFLALVAGAGLFAARRRRSR